MIPSPLGFSRCASQLKLAELTRQSERISTTTRDKLHFTMPHRVVDFFRSPNDSIHSIKQTVQRHTSPTAHAGSKERQRPSRTSSYGSSHNGVVEDHTTTPPVKLLEPTKEIHKERHRISFPSLHLVGHKTQKDLSENASASLDWRIESAPAVMYGGPEDSTGALISGQLQLRVKEDTLEVENLEAKLEICVTQKKPFSSYCQDCGSQRTELKSWSFLSEPTVLTQRAPSPCSAFELLGRLT